MRGKGVGLILRAALHLEEVEFLQRLAREVAVELVVADFVREHHRHPDVVEAVVEEDEAIAPVGVIHAEQVLVVVLEQDMDVEPFGDFERVAALGELPCFLREFIAFAGSHLSSPAVSVLEAFSCLFR